MYTKYAARYKSSLPKQRTIPSPIPFEPPVMIATLLCSLKRPVPSAIFFQLTEALHFIAVAPQHRCHSTSQNVSKLVEAETVCSSCTRCVCAQTTSLQNFETKRTGKLTPLLQQLQCLINVLRKNINLQNFNLKFCARLGKVVTVCCILCRQMQSLHVHG